MTRTSEELIVKLTVNVYKLEPESRGDWLLLILSLILRRAYNEIRRFD